MVKVFNKPTSITSNDFKNKLVNEGLLSKKSCYCGRLDPMARGEMLFLEDLECKSMDKFLGLNKIYEFEIILGLSTDTDDILGLLETYNFNDSLLLKLQFENQLKDYLQIKTQKFHRYSSYMLRKGNLRKPLWQWQKLDLLEEDDIPEKNIDVSSLKILEIKNYKLCDLMDAFISKIQKLDKLQDFRQVTLIEKWSYLKRRYPEINLKSYKVSINVSSGFYVRQLGNDIKNRLNFPLLIYDIDRKSVIY